MLKDCDVCKKDIDLMNDEDYCISGIMMCASCYDALECINNHIHPNRSIGVFLT